MNTSDLCTHYSNIKISHLRSWSTWSSKCLQVLWRSLFYLCLQWEMFIFTSRPTKGKDSTLIPLWPITETSHPPPGHMMGSFIEHYYHSPSFYHRRCEPRSYIWTIFNILLIKINFKINTKDDKVFNNKRVSTHWYELNLSSKIISCTLHIKRNK